MTVLPYNSDVFLYTHKTRLQPSYSGCTTVEDDPTAPIILRFLSTLHGAFALLLNQQTAAPLQDNKSVFKRRRSYHRFQNHLEYLLKNREFLKCTSFFEAYC